MQDIFTRSHVNYQSNVMKVLEMTVDLLIAFMAFCFVSSVTPGPNNLMLMASGANFGFKRTVPHWLGIGIGFTAMILIVGFGLNNIFETYPQVYTILKITCVIFLVYLAWKIANASPVSNENKNSSQPITFLQAAAFQWVNPKAWAMALSAITVYTPVHTTGAILVTALIFGSINLPSCSIWIWIGQWIRRRLTNSKKAKIFNLTMAFLLLTSLYPMLK